MSPTAAMVFAAGFGTRMGALTADRPKPLIAVAGRALIDHALDRVEAAGIGLAVVNLHYRGAMIRAHLAGRRSPRILFSDEAGVILDTGGGVRAALPLLGPGPVATLNADAIWAGAEPLTALMAGWRPGMEALLHLVPRGSALGHAGRGDFFCDAAGRLTRRGAAEAAPFVYTGASLMTLDRIAAMAPGVFSLNPVWDAMAAAGGLFGVPDAGIWADVGTPAGIGLAESLLAGGQA